MYKKHLNKNNHLKKVFNKHNMLISYSCTANIKSIVKAHNNNFLKRKNKMRAIVIASVAANIL